MDDQVDSAKFILDLLQNTEVKAYLLFLKYVLNFFNSFNALFQSKKVLIHVLHLKTNKLLHQICRNYMKSEIAMEEDLTKINLALPSYFLDLEKIVLGPECTAILKTVSYEKQQTFRKHILKFYTTAAEDLQKRMPNVIFRACSFLDPNIAFNSDIHVRNVDFNTLCNKFNVINIDISELATE